MNVEKLLEEIKVAKNKIAEYQNDIRKTEQDIANHLCPFKVGQEVISPRGEEQFIASIKFSGSGSMYEFKVFKKKKDGKSFTKSCYAWEQGGYKAIENKIN